MPSLDSIPAARGLMAAAFLLAVAGSGSSVASAAGDAPADVRYDRDVRPILAEHCLGCHGPDAGSRQADLRLDSAESIAAGAIMPGDPAKSEIIRRVVAAEPDVRMPPPAHGPGLAGKDVEILRRWINQGAVYETHWAFQPIRRPPVPATTRPTAGDVDRFLVAAREARGLPEPSLVDRRRLIRRATIDLTGLPPAWEDVEAFVADPDPEPAAFARVVDRLLASPRYGERWGRHWLDIARYADTHGGAAIGFTRFPFSYTYRDYVVRSFNDDLPWDRFIIEQVAADQLGLAANDPALAGLGFLTVGMQFRNRFDLLDDQIDVVSRGLMGLTVACARCHDHKYDPVSTADYYSLVATFAPSRPPELPPVIGTPQPTPALADYTRELGRRRAARDDMARDQGEVMKARLRMQAGLYLRELAAGKPEQDTTTAFLSFRTDDIRPVVLERWRSHIAAAGDDDPVFGPWNRLARLPRDCFAEACAGLVAGLAAEPAAAGVRLGDEPPRWNPLVLAALARRAPASLAEVADAYGGLFQDVHREWLAGLGGAAEEAAAAGVIPDDDPRHETVNSPVRRQLRHHLFAPGTPTAVDDDLVPRLLNRTVKDTLGGRSGAIAGLQFAPGSPPRAMTLDEDPDPPATRILRRGNPLDRGAEVAARFPAALAAAAPEEFPAGRRRLGLARALASPDNPLVRRVIVNWAWQHHFGAGLVRTPDDFGTRGRPPTHPELLDWLAEALRDDGWSLKALHRRIMLSDAYRTAAVENPAARTADPDDELLWRAPRRRLDLEAMRDSMLAVSGELDLRMGGPPVEIASGSGPPRRTLYGFVNRDVVAPLAATFDAANPSACTARREETTIPQQALFALNSPFVQDRAAAFAAAAAKAVPDGDADRVAWMFRRAVSREPSAAELAEAVAYVAAESAAAEGAAAAWRRFAQVLLAGNEFHFID